MANKVDSLAKYARLSHLPSGFFLNVFEIPMSKCDGSYAAIGMYAAWIDPNEIINLNSIKTRWSLIIINKNE